MAMDLQILSAEKYSVKLKATIHATGKLGFTEPTAKTMNMTNAGGIKFGRGADDNLYIVYCPVADEQCFKVQKAGLYYYVNAKLLFDDLGLDYKRNVIFFDLAKVKGETNTYKITKRTKERKKEKEEETF
jgi:hypothetical protein